MAAVTHSLEWTAGSRESIADSPAATIPAEEWIIHSREWMTHSEEWTVHSGGRMTDSVAQMTDLMAPMPDFMGETAFFALFWEIKELVQVREASGGSFWYKPQLGLSVS